MNKKSSYIFLIVFLLLLLIFYDFNQAQYTKKALFTIIRLINDPNKWEKDFNEVQIESKFSKQKQHAYLYKSVNNKPRPLVVSLHTWGGDYMEKDPIAELCLENNLNYIHPNFNGPNNNPKSCCSELVIGQIDEAINYAVLNSNVDKQNIHIIGLSGGGYTAFCHYLLSNFPVKSYQSWVGISDLESWYYQSISLENPVWEDILACTNSIDTLNIHEAGKRSPLYMPVKKDKLSITILDIYTGIHDGIRGSVPVTHSINFYNKIVHELYGLESHEMVTEKEKLHLLEHKRPLGKYGTIGNRNLFLAKTTPKVNLFVFDGEHEILPKYAISNILQKNKFELNRSFR